MFSLLQELHFVPDVDLACIFNQWRDLHTKARTTTALVNDAVAPQSLFRLNAISNSSLGIYVRQFAACRSAGDVVLATPDARLSPFVFGEGRGTGYYKQIT